MVTLAELMRRPEEHAPDPRIAATRSRLGGWGKAVDNAAKSLADFFPSPTERGSLGYDEDGNLVGYAPESAQVSKTLNFMGPDAVGAAMQGLAPGVLRAIGVWHGSPHKFDRFDLSKIGTGEGAQAYGHGLYFAENPEVAGQYATELSRKITANGNPIMAQGKQVGSTGNPGLDDYLMGYGGDVQSAIEGMLFDLRDIRSGPAGKNNPQIKDAQRDLLALRQLRGNVETGTEGNLYKTSLQWPDPAREAADPLGPEHFLDWDLPVSQQSQSIQDAVAKINPYKYRDGGIWLGDKYMGPGDPGDEANFWAGAVTGENVVRTFRKDTGKLSEAGIPGIKYLDAGSRGAGDGSRNFVVFDDSLAKILERNGVPLK